MRTSGFLSRNGKVAVGAALALGLFAATARADRLDAQLSVEAPKIVEALRKQGVKNVGVLRFRVQEGKRAESFTTGPINGNLVTRLENALILNAGTDEKDALGIIRDAGAEAARQGVNGWFGNEAEQQKLFAVSTYPLAWGESQVKANVFLTGVIKVPADYRSCTVTIEQLTAPGKLEKLSEFSMPTDVALLRDLGKSFSLVRRGAKVGDRSPQALRKRAVDQIAALGGEGGGGGADASDAPLLGKEQQAINIGGIEFQIMDNDQPVEIKESADPERRSQYEIKSPTAESVVTFRATNKTDRTLGLDVHLNGLSVLFERSEMPELCRVFVLKPGVSIRIRGVYQEGEANKYVVAPFKVLVGPEAKRIAADLGPRAGEVQVTVFEELKDEDRPKPVVGKDDKDDKGGKEDKGLKEDEDRKTDDALPISFRGARPRELKRASSSLASLQAALLKASGLKKETTTENVGGKLVKRELFVPDNAARKPTTVDVVDFERNPTPVGAVTLWVMPR